jgi:outer membrane lipoprotein-sorting protein
VKKRILTKILIAVLLLVGTACIKRTRKVPEELRLLPAKNATRAELFQGLEEKSKQIQTMQGKMTIVLSSGGPKSGVLTDYHETTGLVVVERPSLIFIKVQVPLILSTVADMVANGMQYRIWVPLKNQFMIGDATAPANAKGTVSDLRPQQFLDGLFVDIRPYLNKPQVKYLFEEAVLGRRSYYVFSFIDVSGEEAQLLEKVWIDRSDDLEVGRKQVFGKDGRVESDVSYSNYHKEEGIQFAQDIVLQLPVQDYTVKMTFLKTTFNEKVPENVFNLERPEGAELVQLAQ